MKRNLFYLFALICSMSLFTACSDDEKPEVPPTVEDIIAEYSAENLKPTIEGATVSAADVKVELAAAGASDKVTVILHNVVPGAPEFKIPDAEFAATTRSAYISTLKGEVSDDLTGYKVKVDGVVDEKVLTVSIVLTEIEGENINTKDLINLVYKGDMDINVGDAATPITMVQRVYVQKARTTNMAKRDTSMVKLQIKNFAFEGMSLGDITLDTVLIQKRGEVLAFKEAGRKISLAPVGDVIANLSGTIVGEKVNLSLDIDASGLKVGVGFSGVPVKESTTVSMEEMKIESSVIVMDKKTTLTYTFSVWDNVAAKDLLLTPKYKVGNNGSISHALLHIEGKEDVRLSQDQIDGKQPIDFSVLKTEKDYIRYILVPEDPNAKGRNFDIKVERMLTSYSYDMKEWISGNPKGLNSSNDAATFLPIMIGNPLPAPGLPVTKAEDGAARITSFKTESNYGALVPAITAGTLFTGSFEIDMENTLRSTKFGVPYNGKKPASFKFTYKYTPGEKLYRHKLDGDKGVAELVEGKDECSITAYLFEVSDYSEALDGTNINKSSKVILKAALADGTAKNDYVSVTVPFTETGNGTFDATKKYKLAIVCTPSKWGDQFKGGDLSSLYVKSLVVE